MNAKNRVILFTVLFLFIFIVSGGILLFGKYTHVKRDLRTARQRVGYLETELSQAGKIMDSLRRDLDSEREAVRGIAAELEQSEGIRGDLGKLFEREREANKEFGKLLEDGRGSLSRIESLTNESRGILDNLLQRIQEENN